MAARLEEEVKEIVQVVEDEVLTSMGRVISPAVTPTDYYALGLLNKDAAVSGVRG